jgi:hypothetical protein
MKNPLRYFKTSPKEIRLAVTMWIFDPVSLRQLEGLCKRGIITIIGQPRAAK